MNDKKKMTPLMTCHLILMVIFALGSLAIGVLLLIAASSGEIKGYQTSASLIVSIALCFLLNVPALCCGILYLVKGYAKSAAAFYKGFLLISAVAVLANGYVFSITPALTDNAEKADPQTTLILRIIVISLLVAKFLILMILTFAKDLGKRNTWILFGILLAVDLVFALFIQTTGSFIVIRITNVLSRLLMTGTIGLAIKGKYDDKDARGTT